MEEVSEMNHALIAKTAQHRLEEVLRLVDELDVQADEKRLIHLLITGASCAIEDCARSEVGGAA